MKEWLIRTLRKLAASVLILMLAALLVIAAGRWLAGRKTLRGFDASIFVQSDFPTLVGEGWETSGVLLEMDQGYIFIRAAGGDGKVVDEGDISEALIGNEWVKESDRRLHRTDNDELLCEIIPVGPSTFLLAQVPRSHLSTPPYLTCRKEALKLAGKPRRSD